MGEAEAVRAPEGEIELERKPEAEGLALAECEALAESEEGLPEGRAHRRSRPNKAVLSLGLMASASAGNV